MKPYFLQMVIGALLSVLLADSGWAAHGKQASTAPVQQTQAPSQVANTPAGVRPQPVRMHTNEAIRQAFEHYYNLEYDRAIELYQQVYDAHPQDPFAVNYLLSGVLFRELYRTGALNTGLYSNNSFLDIKPVPPDPKVKARIKELIERALELSEQRLKTDPRDVHALYARGVTRGLRSTYTGMIEKAWFSALRSASGARGDHEDVLKLDPNYSDAKFSIGIHNYIIGSLSWATKMAIAFVGIGGSKKKGLDYLFQAAEAEGENSVDARIALSLFLRREQRYGEALELVRRLSVRYPRNFLFAVEVANVLNDMGRGREAIAAYQLVLERGQAGRYAQSRLEFAAFGLGEALKGQGRYAEAAAAYELVPSFSNVDAQFQQQALVAAGQMHDVLHQREIAVIRYRAALNSGPEDSEPAKLARKFIKHAYRLSEARGG